MGEWKLFPRTMAWRRCWIVMCLLLWQPVVVSPLSLRSVQWQTKSSSSNSTKPKLQESATAISVPVPQTRRQTTSSNCKSFRPMEDYYTAELQLYYVYWVEFAASAKSRSLAGLEAAITSSIANAFVDFCDVLDRPMVKVKANMRHQFSKDAFCAPHTKGNTCSVVNGATAILLDTRSSNIQDIVYDAITHGLNDTDMLQAFSPFVVGAQFQIALGETLLAAPTYTENASPGPITAAVAVAAASVSFVVASIFCYGLMRRQMRHHPEPSVRYKFRRRKMGHPTMGLKPPRRRRRFIRLDELSHPSDEEDDDDYDEEEVEDYSPHHHPSITWSISDITSDSASCMSGMSCTTSRLERIEEEEEEDDNCEGLPTRKRKRGKWRPTSYRSSVECIGLDTISRVEEEVSELAVSQYVSEVPCVRSVTPESVEGSPGDLAVLPAMPEVDDLQISLDDNDDDDIVSLEEPLDPLAIDWQEENEQDEDEMIEASEEISESLLDDIREKVLTIKQVASEAASSHEDKQDAASPDNEAATIMLEKVDWKLDMILPENYEVQDTFPTGAQDGVVDSMGMEIDLTKSEQSFHSPGIEGDIDLEHSKSFCSCEELQSPLPQAKDHVFFTPLQYPPEAICSANANEKVVDMAVQDSSGVCGGSSPQIEVPEEERNESIPMEERTVRSCEADSIECDDDQSIGISRKTV